MHLHLTWTVTNYKTLANYKIISLVLWNGHYPRRPAISTGLFSKMYIGSHGYLIHIVLSNSLLQKKPGRIQEVKQYKNLRV